MQGSSTSYPDRRRFVAGAFATAVSAGRVFGANETIRIGAIGTGSRCQYLLGLLNKLGGNEVVAVCDVYEPWRAEVKAKYATADARE